MSSAVSPSFSAIYGHDGSLLFIVIRLNRRCHHVPLPYDVCVDDYKWENSLGGIIIEVNCWEVWFAADNVCTLLSVFYK